MAGMSKRSEPHLTELELADLLDHKLSKIDKTVLEEHIAACEECLAKAVSAYESVAKFRETGYLKKKEKGIMKGTGFYLILAVFSFIFSFITPRYFIQFLVLTILLGIKWIVDSKTTRMLVMIYEAWKTGKEEETSRIFKMLDSKTGARF